MYVWAIYVESPKGSGHFSQSTFPNFTGTPEQANDYVTGLADADGNSYVAAYVAGA